MKTTKIVSCVVAAVIGLGGSTVWADSLCPDTVQQTAADTQLKQAEDLERAGRVREAYGAAGKVNGHMGISGRAGYRRARCRSLCLSGLALPAPPSTSPLPDPSVRCRFPGRAR